MPPTLSVIRFSPSIIAQSLYSQAKATVAGLCQGREGRRRLIENWIFLQLASRWSGRGIKPTEQSNSFTRLTVVAWNNKKGKTHLVIRQKWYHQHTTEQVRSKNLESRKHSFSSQSMFPSLGIFEHLISKSKVFNCDFIKFYSPTFSFFNKGDITVMVWIIGPVKNIDISSCSYKF